MPSYVITGANRGLGYALLSHLAKGPTPTSNIVICLSRSKSEAEARLASDPNIPKGSKSNVHFLEADITDLASLKKAAEAVSSITGGKLDVLINNAAYVSKISEYWTLVDSNFSSEEFEDDTIKSVRTNVVGVAHTIRAFLPLIRMGDLKKVITLSTGMADLDFIADWNIAIGAPYSISKAATNALVAKFHAASGKTENILFLAISPGLVATWETEPTEEEKKGYEAMGRMFAEYAPHFNGPISPPESATLILDVVAKANVEKDGGRFVSHFGNKQWL